MENTQKQYIDINIIKSLMKSKRIDENELAKLMDIALPRIKKFLNGADQSYMSSIILYKLAIALDVKAHSLINQDYL